MSGADACGPEPLLDRRRREQSLRAVDFGLAGNVLLAGLKLSVGALGHSPALFADGINSLSDVAYYAVVRVVTVLGHKPPDEEHPYGYERMESIAALLVGAFVMATGLAVAGDAFLRLHGLLSQEVQQPRAVPAAFWVALFGVALKLWLWSATWKASRRTANPALTALALDHRNDVFSSAAASVGIVLSRTGYPAGDPAAAAAVSVVILLSGIGILRRSSSDLMGGQPARELAQQIRTWILKVQGVEALELIRGHSFGPYLVLNVTIGVDGSMSVAEGDLIADEVERVLFDRLEFVRAVHVHYHPSRDGAQGP